MHLQYRRKRSHPTRTIEACEHGASTLALVLDVLGYDVVADTGGVHIFGSDNGKAGIIARFRHGMTRTAVCTAMDADIGSDVSPRVVLKNSGMHPRRTAAV